MMPVAMRGNPPCMVDVQLLTQEKISRNDRKQGLETVGGACLRGARHRNTDIKDQVHNAASRDGNAGNGAISCQSAVMRGS